jgi:hypothetical protein
MVAMVARRFKPMTRIDSRDREMLIEGCDVPSISKVRISHGMECCDKNVSVASPLTSNPYRSITERAVR